MANPISLAAYRHRLITQRALADLQAERAAAARAPVTIVYLAAEAGKVLLRFSDGGEVDLSPDHAETWAGRLAEMASTARALAKDGAG